MRRAALILTLLSAAACGKAGPPLPPLHLVPDAVTDVKPRRSGDEVRFSFVLPTKNVNGTGAVDLGRVEVYAATVAPGALPPTNRELFTPKHVVATLDVRAPEPPPGEKPGTSPAPPAKDTRPGPGDLVTITEKLDAAKLTPEFTTPMVSGAKLPGATTAAGTTTPATTTAVTPPPVTPATPPVTPPTSAVMAPPTAASPPVSTTVPVPTETPTPTTPAAAATLSPAAAAAAALAKVPRRIYVIRGVSRSGRTGQPTGRMELPLFDLPAAPTAVSAKYTASALTLTWTPAATESTTPVFFNVYSATGTTPINPTPLKEPTFERPGIEFGTEECFVARTVAVAGAWQLESPPSDRVCITPVDTFAPADPRGLSAVGGSGLISLIWDANTETDLAGYLVLRGEAPGDKLQALTQTPIKETTFTDKTVKPGVRYVYAIVAVDRATPPNLSGQSNRVEESAR
jgi:predicted small lipoprotein YifL